MSTKTTIVGVGRFLHGAGALVHLQDEIDAAGGAPLVIGGTTGIELIGPALPEQRVDVIRHEGPCTRAAAERYAQRAAAEGATVIVGIGGGIVIDLAKAVATLADLPIITVPTSIATCVAASAVSIMYTDDGRPDGSISLTRGIAACIADLDMIRAAPRRLLNAGVLDTMAKLPELRHPRTVQTGEPHLAQAGAIVLAAQLWDFHSALLAVISADAPVTVEQSSEATLCNLLLTGIISGLCAGDGQLAIAHSFYDWVRAEVPEVRPRFLHGEIVGVGILIQKMFNGEDSEDTRSLMQRMGAPTTIADLEIQMTTARRTSLQSHLARTTGVAPDGTSQLAAAIARNTGEVHA
ncbi:MAG: iron-containing alcohol dehydrogenase [Microbacterium sp.]